MSDLTTATLRNYRIVPIIVIDDLKYTDGVIGALLEGGIPVAEITLRTPIALKVLEQASEKFPSMIAGAGTVLNADQARAAIAAGARFIVSPGFSSAVHEIAQAEKIPYFPGVATATEIQSAISYGLSLLKFFPAEQLGGLATITALSSAFVDVEFMPSGGVSESNYIEYLNHPKVPIIGGSWIASRGAISAGEFDQISARARKVTSAISELEMK